MNFLRKFMEGRYGVDELNKFLLVVSIIISVIYNFTKISILNIISLALLVFLFFRIFSKNINKRLEENRKFTNVVNPYRRKFNSKVNQLKNKKDYRYFDCPNCGKSLRVPRGKGMIKITCPNCNTKITRKS